MPCVYADIYDFVHHPYSSISPPTLSPSPSLPLSLPNIPDFSPPTFFSFHLRRFVRKCIHVYNVGNIACAHVWYYVWAAFKTKKGEKEKGRGREEREGRKEERKKEREKWMDENERNAEQEKRRGEKEERKMHGACPRAFQSREVNNIENIALPSVI